MSGALRLRNRALMIGLTDGLDLTAKIDLPAVVAQDLRLDLAESEEVLIVGCSLSGLVPRLLEMPRGGQARIDIIESAGALAGLPIDPAESRVRFIEGWVDDYAADPAAIDNDLGERAITSCVGLKEMLEKIEARRRTAPLMPDESKELVIHDLVANRLDRAAFRRALAETFRVLRRQGTFYMTAFLADESTELEPGPVRAVPGGLRRMPLEPEILDDLRLAGFHGMTMRLLHDAPVYVREGVEMRAFAVRAYKGTQGSCLDQGHAVIYKGPWSRVSDDDDHAYRRGERTAVCAKTYELLMRAPYAGQFAGLPAYHEVPLAEAPPFDCRTPEVRPPAVTKGRRPLREAADAGLPCCGDEAPSGCC